MRDLRIDRVLYSCVRDLYLRSMVRLRWPSLASVRPAYSCTTRVSQPSMRSKRRPNRDKRESLLWAMFPSNRYTTSVIPQDPYIYRKPGDIPRISPDDHSPPQSEPIGPKGLGKNDKNEDRDSRGDHNKNTARRRRTKKPPFNIVRFDKSLTIYQVAFIHNTVVSSTTT